MDIEEASVFFISSILAGMGLIVLAGTITIINNILSKYWKPVNFGYLLPKIMTMPDTPPARFVDPQELHHVDKTTEPTLDLSKNR